MLQGTYSHEPPGTLSVFRSVGGRHSIHVADRIQQVALTRRGWVASAAWCFEALPPDAEVLISCLPTVNKAAVAAAIGATDAAQSVGERTTSSVVQTISLVIILDALAALWFMHMGW